MLLTFLTQLANAGDRIVAIDLSARTTKAVYLRRKGEGFVLASYCLQEAPGHEKLPFREAFAAHLQSVHHTLGASTKDVVLVAGMEEAMLRTVESPWLGRSEARQLVRLNAKHFFQQDVADLALDCFAPERQHDTTAPTESKPANFLVATMKKKFLADLEAAARSAGLNPVQITLSQTSLANAALLATSKVAVEATIALLHLGSETSTISFLSAGTLPLTRVVGIGSHQLGRRLTEAYKPAEAGSSTFETTVYSNMKKVLAPLTQDVRAGIDYFEDLQGRKIQEGFVSGDWVRSELIVEALQGMDVRWRRLDPAALLSVSAETKQRPEIEQELPQLDVAVGAATGRLSSEAIDIDLMAEQFEAAELRRRDPVRRAIIAGATVVLLLLAWAGGLKARSWRIDTEVGQAQAEFKSLEKMASEGVATARKVAQMEQTLRMLEQHATNRFLWALPLDSLQRAVMDNIQVVNLRIEQTLIHVEATKGTASAPAKSAQTKEQIVMTITAKNFADDQIEEKFIESIAELPYFKTMLRQKDPVLLKGRLGRQVDPLDVDKTFRLFTIECVYRERVLGHD